MAETMHPPPRFITVFQVPTSSTHHKLLKGWDNHQKDEP